MSTMENGPPLVSIPLADYQILVATYNRTRPGAAPPIGSWTIEAYEGSGHTKWVVFEDFGTSRSMRRLEAYSEAEAIAMRDALNGLAPPDAERLGVVPVSDGPSDQGARAAHPPRSTTAVTDAELVQLGERAVRGYLDFDEARKWFAERQP